LDRILVLSNLTGSDLCFLGTETSQRSYSFPVLQLKSVFLWIHGFKSLPQH